MEFELAGHVIKEGDYISIDGSTGNIYGEAIPTVAASISGDFDRFMKWADARRTLRSAPTLILPVTPPRLWPLAPRASVCAAPSTCFFEATALRPSAR